MVDYIFFLLHCRLVWYTFTNYRYNASWLCLARGLHFVRPLYYSRLYSWLESAHKTSHMFVSMPLTWSPIAQSSLVLLWFGLPKENGSSSTIHVSQTLSTLFNSSFCSLFLYLTGWTRYAVLENLRSLFYWAYVNNFYIHGSVHRDSILIRSSEMQQYAGVYLLHNYSTCFGCLSHPSSGVHQTVTAASGTGHSVRVTTFRQRGL